jgi:hypothetical protein
LHTSIALTLRSKLPQEPRRVDKSELNFKILDPQAWALTEDYKVALDALSNLVKKINAAGAEKFSCPGSSTFNFSDPIINHEGALVCKTAYGSIDNFRNPQAVRTSKVPP